MPEPFSPTKAWTSPAWQSKLTSVSARTAPNCRETPFNSEDQVPRVCLSSRIAVAHSADHEAGNIRVRTESGTSDVPETACGRDPGCSRLA